MMLLAIFSISAALALRAVSKVYSELPISELKRKVHGHNSDSARLLLVASYGYKAQVLLGSLMAFFVAQSAYALGQQIGGWVILASAALITYLYVEPYTNGSAALSRRLAVVLAPYIGRLLSWLNPLLTLLLPANIEVAQQQKLYDKESLIAFLDAQKAVSNSRLNHEQIDKLIRTLKTREKHISNIMTDRKHMKLLQENDSVGPILLSELYDSKQTAFAVENADGGFSGVVGLSKLSDLREGGQVKRAMDSELAFVNEDWLAGTVLTAYLDTKKDIFLVVDELSNVSGIVSLDQVIESNLNKSLHAGRQDYRDAETISASSN